MNPQLQEACSVRVVQSLATTQLLARMRAEFRELPGMHLSLDQAARLWTVGRERCEAALEELVAEEFLERDQFGRFKKRGWNH